MSTLQAANISNGTDTIATGYVVNGSAKAWAAVNQATPAILGSLNVSSLTDLGVGNTELNYTSNMATVNYSAQFTSGSTTSLRTFCSYTNTPPATNKVTMFLYSEPSLAFADATFVTATITGDLA